VNPDAGFVPKVPGNVVPPSVAFVVAGPTVEDDETEKLNCGDGWVAVVVVLAELEEKKPGLEYAAELLNDVGDDDTAALVTVTIATRTSCYNKLAAGGCIAAAPL